MRTTAGADGLWRVVRGDRGAVLVVPAAAGASGATGAGEGLHGGAEAGLPSTAPERVPLDRDGLVPGADGERVPPVVGDLVLRDADGLLLAVAPRRTALVRDSAGRTSRTQVLAANVDVVLVVEHLDPDPDLGRVERLLTLAWRSGARPLVVLTKADLVPDPAGMTADVAAVALGAEVLAVSVPRDEGLGPLRALLTPGTTLVAVGPSGAGKSTLVNALAGQEVMATGARRADGRGRHTTTHRELVALPGGALLVDTPGIRGVGLVADDAALERSFADVADLALGCRFADCAHASEPGCAVRAALEDGALDPGRLERWRRLRREAAHQARREDARLAAEERARVRRLTREHHRVAPRR
ncbi:ribosome small subunit-dependent GTPase A [Cellulomonas endophytica]|uniref:ribosome small subunit-dependent GTPase A n=1 Tax=Cellulomonas endophytica TaxID=2494735 RepID=UPI00101296E4|nr:ribosome small subunit-dependent GTPase A [Cellulomonas endophytica]